MLQSTSLEIICSSVRPSHGETTSKQEVHKLKVSVIRLFDSSMKHVSR